MILVYFSLGVLSPSNMLGENMGMQEGFRRIHQVSSPANGASCSECHAVPFFGGSSPVTVVRAGDRRIGQYIGVGQTGTIHRHNELAPPAASISGLRVALNLLGDGYVEAVADSDLMHIAARQKTESHGRIHGQWVEATVPESSASLKSIGRFGWKAQHVSLLSASSEALFSELGVPNQVFPTNSTAAPSKDLDSILTFIRKSQPIPPDPERSASEFAVAGAKIFNHIGCAICHVETLKTGVKGTMMDGGLVAIPDYLADQKIHPFSDFLLHDVGTGDGILENIRPEDYDESTANKFRTAPLWGVRYRNWMMHDGKSVTYHQAIIRHAGEASEVITRYQDLTPIEKDQLRQFLDSL